MYILFVLAGFLIPNLDPVWASQLYRASRLAFSGREGPAFKDAQDISASVKKIPDERYKAVAYSGLAEAYALSGNKNQAIRFSRYACRQGEPYAREVDPVFAWSCRYAKAMELMARGKPAEAAARIQELALMVQERDPDRPHVFVLHAAVWLAASRAGNRPLAEIYGRSAASRLSSEHLGGWLEDMR